MNEEKIMSQLLTPSLSEMCCCHCQSKQQIKIRGLGPHLTNCHSCKKLLVVDVVSISHECGEINVDFDLLRVESKTNEKPKMKQVA
jgi:hypothetical protein